MGNVPSRSEHLTPHEARRIAVAAAVDPRTVLAYLAGRAVTSTVAARIHDALIALRGNDPREAAQ